MTSGFPQRLTEGYRSFRTNRLPAEQSRYRDLADRGQSPETMIIGCCDSRVSPEVIFDVGPGELFVVRNVANLVPPYSPDDAFHGVSAAIEYAVEVLHVRHIVVLGHGRCGGIRAFAENAPGGDFIGRWISMLAPAAATVSSVATSSAAYLTRLEQASVRTSLANLMTFPFVRTNWRAGSLALHGAYFDVASGELATLDPATGLFCAILPGGNEHRPPRHEP
jgi:carbonic anhydrase